MIGSWFPLTRADRSEPPTEIVVLQTRVTQLERQVERANEALLAASRAVAVANAQADAVQLRLTTRPDLVELDRARRALVVYEDRLAVYEGRPSNLTCPQPCCTPGPVAAELEGSPR